MQFLGVALAPAIKVLARHNLKSSVAELAGERVRRAKNGVWIYASIKHLLGVHICRGDLGIINYNAGKKTVAKYAAPTKKFLHIAGKFAKALLDSFVP